MSTSVEIIVPEASMASVTRALKPLSAVRYETSATWRHSRCLVVSPLDALGSPGGREDVLHAASGPKGVLPVMLLAFLGAAIGVGIASGLAEFSVRAKREPYVAPDASAARRMILALKAGAESKLIASASIEDGYLVVWSCEPKRYEVAVSDVPALAGLSYEALADFQISDSGSRIHWPDGDVDLGLDAIRGLADPAVRKAQDAKRRKDAARYARAIRAVRLEHKLKQSDVAGLSERQVRRIESGEVVPHASTLEKLAQAHGMEIAEYMDALAKRASRKTA